ncbi:MAG: TAXI family TRAP transporter solute-binding subunit, partial [Lentisphaeria bacterium]|nr:TAXI family TRAP transporter solute-binding subunit [Lentisphaeria bacterium]
MKKSSKRSSIRRKDWLLSVVKIWGSCILVIVVITLILFKFLEPPPPTDLKIASGSKGGAYYQFAVRYKSALAEHGIKLEVLETQGTIENYSLMKSGKVDLAFIQGGCVEIENDSPIQSVASVSYEPVWLFLRKGFKLDDLRELLNKKVNVGTEGSGTKALAIRLLQMTGVNEGNCQFSYLSYQDTVTALKNSELDAAFIVASINSQVIRDLIADPKIMVMDFKRAAAYTYKADNLSHIIIPQGVIDLEKNLPKEDFSVLSTSANLCSSSTMHPQQVELVLSIMAKIHGEKDLITKKGYFPNAEFVE